jgi:uncharacterized protein
MPVRSLGSSVVRWPDRQQVEAALSAWARANATSDVVGIGYFGSYARGEWGVGSDVDVVIVLKDTSNGARRDRLGPGDWDATGLPVPADVLVYTEGEWASLLRRRDRFSRVLQDEVVWVHGTAPSVPAADAARPARR